MTATEPAMVVVTGGPGAGKTTLLAHLAGRGLACTEEAGRGVIRDQVAIGGRGLPWDDRALFAELMLGWEMRSIALARGLPGPVLCDRGIPDIIGYLRLEGLPVPAHLHRAAAACRYRRKVFLAPFWPEIYRQDGERRQDADTARRTADAMARAYADCGYGIVELPRVPVAARAELLLSHLSRNGCG